MQTLKIRPFSESEARAVSSWSSEPPFDIYNGDPSWFEDYLAIDADGYGFYALTNADDEVVGFCCFGAEARVSGQAPAAGVVDIGGGVRPDLVSNGIATQAFPAIIGFATSTFEATTFRTAVASFNQRSTRLCLAAGFRIARSFEGPGGEFRELLRSDPSV